MATVVPPQPMAGVTASERAVLDALRDALPAPWVVVHGFRLLDAKQAVEREIDFLLLHPQHGLLVLECKGHGVFRDTDGRWYRDGKRPGSREPAKDPVEQAQQQLHTLVDIVRKRVDRLPEFQRRRGPLPLTFGYGLIFPFATERPAFELEAIAPQLVLTAESLAHIEQAVINALGFWSKRFESAPLDSDAFDVFVNRAVFPALQIVSTLGERIRGQRAQMARLHDEQCAALALLEIHRRFAVRGGAGTGKTVLAIEAARRLAEQGEHVLLVVFNRALAAHVRQALHDERALVEVVHFHALCEQAATALGMTPEYPDRNTPDDERRRFWNVAFPAQLAEAAARGLMPRWNAVIVDEAQDLDASWWPMLDALLEGGHTGRLVAFYDLAQAIFDKAPGLDALPTMQHLFTNFRSTRTITASFGSLAAQGIVAHGAMPEGMPVETIEQPTDRDAARALLGARIQQLTREGLHVEDIAVIAFGSTDESAARGFDRIGGCVVSDDPEDRRGRLLVTTAGRFKGLEADVVILCDVDPDDDRCSTQLRYVAASRARHHLVVMGRGDWLAR